MTIRQVLEQRIAAEPFEPFALKSSSGDIYDVNDPQSIALLTRCIYIALPHSLWAYIPYDHVSVVQSIHADFDAST